MWNGIYETRSENNKPNGEQNHTALEIPKTRLSKRKSSQPTVQSHDLVHASKRSKTLEAKVDSSKEIKQDPGADNTIAKNEHEEALKQKLHQKEEEFRQKNEEIEKIKRRQNLENQDLKARIEQLEEEVKILKSELEQVRSELKELKSEREQAKSQIKELKSELEEVKSKSKESEENSLKIDFGSMCDKMQKNFYQYVFYPHDFSQHVVESFQARYIARDIDEGNYGLTSRKLRRKAKKEWEKLQKDLGWDKDEHVRGIKELKRMRASSAHPTITREMKGKLEEGLKKVFSDIHQVQRAQKLIDIWSKSEQLVEEKMKSATSHVKLCASRQQK